MIAGWSKQVANHARYFSILMLLSVGSCLFTFVDFSFYHPTFSTSEDSQKKYLV